MTRTAVDSFYAVLSLDFESPDRDGTFDVVMHYQAPATFRFTAFKDLIVSTHDLFDLVMTPERFTLRTTPEGEEEPRVFRGLLEDLPKLHPRYRGFCWAAHALFLPGAVDDEPSLEGEFDLEVMTRLPSGIPVRWGVDPDHVHTMGFSLGGITSDLLATLRGEQMASVATYSGGYWSNPQNIDALLAMVVSWPPYVVNNNYAQLIFHGGDTDTFDVVPMVYALSFFSFATNDTLRILHMLQVLLKTAAFGLQRTLHISKA